MAKKPPPLPHEILSRVLNIATFDGRFLMIVAGSLAILHAAAHQPTGAIVGILVAGAGALELHGAGLLRAGDSRGMDWLVRSQLLLLATMLLYATSQLLNPDLAELARIPLSSEQLQTLKQMNMPTEKFFQFVHVTAYTTVGIVTLIYQGIMAIYYHRRRSAVTTALDEELFEALDDRD